MSALATGAAARTGATRGRLRRRPESWVWLLVLAAWVVTLASHEGLSDGHDHSHHGTVPATGGAIGTFAVATLGWLLMITAMMLPVVVPLLYRVAVDTLPRRRQRGISLVLAGYVGVWVVVGVTALLIISPLRPVLTGVGSQILVVIMLVVAAGYELTPVKRRALRRCTLGYRLPPRGVAADRACLTAGLRHGRACLASCAALMAVMIVAGHAQLPLMVLITTLIWAQRLLVIGPRLRWWGAAALAAGAILVAVG